jgi:2-desacetyl-2-hydroxyethyl bacteriochlorophyllide A dehydrogenase
VAYVGICGSDQVRFFHSDRASHKPIVLGHEFSGYIASLPAEETNFVIGQSVTAAPLLNCRVCDFCLNKNENMCPERKRFGSINDGAMQEYVALPTNRIFAIPPNLSIRAGALVEPLAVAYHTVRIAGFESEGKTLVIGAGAIGLLIAQVWRALGNGQVWVIDINKDRLEVAKQLGLQVWETPPAESSVQTLFEASGSSTALSSWLSSLAPRGRAIIVSKLDGQVVADWVTLLRKEVEIATSRYFTISDFEHSLQLLRDSEVDLLPLIGRIVPFQDIADEAGNKVMCAAKNVVRLLIQM